VAAITLLIASGGADALDRMPIDLSLPARADQSETVRLAITPRAVGAARRTTPVDLYLVWAFRPDARFIGPDGAWSAEPVPVRRSVSLAGLGPVTIDWPADPPGAISLALLAVEPGAHPVDRTRWVWSPELRWVTVRAPSTIDARAQRVLAGLGLAAAAGVAIVLVYARRA
jgi:hypothetical protein